MALPSAVNSTDTFNTWRLATNQIISNVYDKTLNMSDVVNAATVRTNLGLEIGTDIQAYVKFNSTTSNPTTTDDTNAGYAIYSIWVNTATDKAYICVDNTASAAVWVNITANASDLGVYTTSQVDALIDDLSGVTDAAGARTNLGVLSSAETNALVDDLSGVTNATTARSNLSVYSTSEVTALIDDLSGVTDAAGARTNLAVDGTAWAIKTTTYTAVSRDRLAANTTSAAFTITLPASPSAGDWVEFIDYAGTFATNALTIARNSSNIRGLAENLVVNTDYAQFRMTYIDSTQGWIF